MVNGTIDSLGYYYSGLFLCVVQDEMPVVVGVEVRKYQKHLLQVL